MNNYFFSSQILAYTSKGSWNVVIFENIYIFLFAFLCHDFRSFFIPEGFFGLFLGLLGAMFIGNSMAAPASGRQARIDWMKGWIFGQSRSLQNMTVTLQEEFVSDRVRGWFFVVWILITFIDLDSEYIATYDDPGDINSIKVGYHLKKREKGTRKKLAKMYPKYNFLRGLSYQLRQTGSSQEATSDHIITANVANWWDRVYLLMK